MMNNSSLPQLPERSLTSQGVLYRPLQDIEIYVEDEESKAFYNELVGRLTDAELRIKSVFPLRGKLKLLEECKKFNAEHPALFLLDGDLDWVAGKEFPSLERLFVHPCYCVENYLFCDQAMVELIVENTGTLTRDDAREKLNWKHMRQAHVGPLVDLFIDFAVAHSLYPELPTISTGIGALLKQKSRKTPPDLDIDKITYLRNQIYKKVVDVKGKDEYEKKHQNISQRVRDLGDSCDAVSGKSYLIPFQMFVLKRFSSQNINRCSFIFRLAKYCRIDKLEPLKEALLNEVIRRKKGSSPE